MKHFNKFKNQIRQENTELPEGLGWDDMQEAILSKMGDRRTNAKSSISGYKMFFTSLIALLCTVSILLIYVHIKNSKTSTATYIVEDKKEGSKPDSDSPDFFVKKNIPSDKGSGVKITNDLNVSNSPTTNLSNLESHNQSSKSGISQDFILKTVTKINVKRESQIEIKNGKIIDEPSGESRELNSNNRTKFKETASNLEYSIESKSNITNSIPSQNTAVGSNDKNVNHETSESNSIQTKERILIAENNGAAIDIGTEAKRNLEILNECPALPIISAGVSSNEIEKYLKGLELDIDPISRLVGKKLWSIELSSGWNTWNYGLSNVDKPNSIFNNTYSEYGFSYSLRLDRKINNRISITSGVDLDFLYKKLEVSYKNYKNREVKNTLLSYTLNTITGQQSNQVYGDTIVVDTIVKLLTDFNKFQVIQIPLIVNYEIFSNPSWRLVAGIGPTISMLTNYNGKYLKNDGLHSYSKTENIYNTSPKIALNVNISISKKLGGNYYVGVRADFKNHFSSWSNQSEAEIKPKIVSGLITLGKSF